MEENIYYCASCLVKSNDALLWKYQFRSSALRNTIQSPLNLCSLCARRAKQLDQFVQNVQKNQSLLHEVTIQPLVKLTITSLESLDLPCIGVAAGASDIIGVETNNDSTSSLRKSDNQQIHKEKSEEEENGFEVPFLAETIYAESDEEQENSDEEAAATEGKGKKKVHKRIILSMSDFMKERAEKALEKTYLNAQFQCTPCVIGFMNKISYQKHMEKHSENAGAYKCDICTQRMKSRKHIKKHRKQHLIRYKCKECPLIRNLLKTIKDHYIIKHSSAEAKQYPCPDCGKIFWIYKSMKVHRRNSHSNYVVKCQFCDKQVKNHSTLRYHVFTHHPNEVSAPEKEKPRFDCSECGTTFSTELKLKRHCSKCAK